jgi:tetratricopeptide (TPR) repeat protein
VRVTEDARLYDKAAALLDGLVERNPDDADVLEASGTLALARHEFAKALELGQRALRANPNSATAYGILVDANNELGRYDDALQATQAMVDTRPSVESYARVSYARELRGDLRGAIEAMQLAASSAAATGGANLAYVQTLLGDLLLMTNDINGAERAFRAADRALPGFAEARMGRAKVLVARERFSEAADLLGRLVAEKPDADHAAAWGDALTAAGRREHAREAYELADASLRRTIADGGRPDDHLALLAADRAPGRAAVELARQVLSGQRSAKAHDALAWSLFRAGQLDEAASESKRALELGTRNPETRYHAAEIAMSGGKREEAAAHMRIVLDGNPRFSARLIPDVARLAQRLGLTMPAPAP